MGREPLAFNRFLPSQEVSTLSGETSQESLCDHRLSDGIWQWLGHFPNENPNAAESFPLSPLSPPVKSGWAWFSRMERLFGEQVKYLNWQRCYGNPAWAKALAGTKGNSPLNRAEAKHQQGWVGTQQEHAHLGAPPASRSAQAGRPPPSGRVTAFQLGLPSLPQRQKFRRGHCWLIKLFELVKKTL